LIARKQRRREFKSGTEFETMFNLMHKPLSLTPRFSGVKGNPSAIRNRFNGFRSRQKTVETVAGVSTAPITPLKRGVNESRLRLRFSAASARRLHHSNARVRYCSGGPASGTAR
jgi:hypothetical protein